MLHFTTQSFIQKSKELFPSKFLYPTTEYTGSKLKTSFFCIKHQHHFEQTPAQHLKGNLGCAECLFELRAKITEIRVKELFYTKLQKLYGDDKFDLSSFVHTGHEEKGIIICNDCDSELNTTPHNILRGTGCANCNRKSMGYDELHYYVKLKHRLAALYKFKESIEGRGITFNDSEFMNRKIPITITCAHGMSKLAIPVLIENLDYCCDKDKYFKAFVRNSRNNHGVGKFDLSLNRDETLLPETRYSLKSLKITCVEHNVCFRSSVACHLDSKSGGCPCCHDDIMTVNAENSRSTTFQEFLQKAELINPDIDFSKSEGEFKGLSYPLTAFCKIHNTAIHKPTANTFYRLDRKVHLCKTCNITMPSTTAYINGETFTIDRFKDMFDDNTSVSGVNFYNIRSNNTVDLYCNTHNVFYTRSVLLDFDFNLECCSLCKAHHLEKEAYEWITKVNQEKLNNFLSFKDTVFRGYSEEVTVTCSRHNRFYEFSILPDKLLQVYSRPCPACKNELRTGGFKKYLAGILYYLRVDFEGEAYYKIGITNHSVQRRYSKRDLKNITILNETYFASGVDCEYDEYIILKMFKEFKYQGRQTILHSGGNSELFTKDVLGLDILS